MRYSTGLVLAALSVGEVVLASPTHAHLHKKAHEKKDVDYSALDWDAMGIDWTSAWAAGQKTKTTSTTVATSTSTSTTATITAATTKGEVLIEAVKTSSATAKATTTSSAASSVETDGSLFNNVVGASNHLTAFGEAVPPSGDVEGDNYRGNIGNPYGSNIIIVPSTTGYDFTNTFVNKQSVSITVNVWQKVGPDNQVLSGSAMAPYNTTLTFALAPGASKTVAFQENTQVAWAQACSATITSGAFATTWGEANFLTKGSGYDVSAILNPSNDYVMTISSVEAPSCISNRTDNYWKADKTPIGTSDGSCFIFTSTATLTTVLAGTV